MIKLRFVRRVIVGWGFPEQPSVVEDGFEENRIVRKHLRRRLRLAGARRIRLAQKDKAGAQAFSAKSQTWRRRKPFFDGAGV